MANIKDIVRQALTETASKPKPFHGKVEDIHYFVNIEGVDNSFPTFPFGRQMEDMRKVNTFVSEAKIAYISIKEKPFNKAFKEFKDLYKPTECYAKTKINSNYKDNSFKIWYKS